MGVWNKHRYGNQGIIVCPAGDSSIAACSRRRLEICEICQSRRRSKSRTGGRCASTLCLLISCRSRLLQPWRGCTYSCLGLPLRLLRRPPFGRPLPPSLHSSPACGSLCCPPCSCPSCCLCSPLHCSPTCSGLGCPPCSCSSSSCCLCSTFHSPSACCLCCPPLRCPSSCLQCTFHSSPAAPCPSCRPPRSCPSCCHRRPLHGSPACQCRPHLKPGQCCPPRSLPCHPPCRPYCEACHPRDHPPCSACRHPHCPRFETSGDPRQSRCHPLRSPHNPRLPHCQACCARAHLPLWYRPPRITLHCLQQGS